MTQVPVQVPETTHTGDGVTVSFLIGFELDAGSGLLVTVDGVPYVFGIGYNIVGTSVVFAIAPANGAAIAWRGVTPIRQDREFPTQATMRPLSVEAALNERAIVDQEHDARLSRALTVPIGETGPQLQRLALRDKGLALFDGAAIRAFYPGPGKLIGQDAASGDMVGVDPNFTVSVSPAVVASRAAAAFATFDASLTFVQTAGYATAGDGGAALYRKVVSEPAHAAKFQSADGAWWELAERFVTFEMFGAKGDALPDGTGTLDTAVIQAAVDFCVPNANAILMSARNFKCGEITTHPYTTIVGTGRHSSAFIAADGTAGRWFTDDGNAAKTMMSGFAMYARSLPGMTGILDLGNNGVQFGTEGILRDLFIRDAINGDGLNINSNVGFFRDISVWNCRRPIAIRGNANMCSGLVSHGPGEGSTGAIAGGPATIYGADLSGCLVDGLEIEAPVSGSVALKINGECRVSKGVISLAGGTSFTHLIEVDNSVYNEFSVMEPLLFPGSPAATVSGGIYKIGGVYRGGTNIAAASGRSILPAIDLHTSELRLDGRLWQSFRVRLIKFGGVLLHRIGQHANVDLAGLLNSKIIGAISDPASTTPTAGAAFVGGLTIDADGQTVVFNTAVTTLARQAATARIAVTNTGASSADMQARSLTVNGVAAVRLGVKFYKPDGTVVTLTSMVDGDYVNFFVEGYIE